MKPVSVEDITVETLDEVAAELNENRILNLTRDEVIQIGEKLRAARKYASDIELRARLRAMKLHFQHGMEPKEIAQLLMLSHWEIKRWLKGN